jgi:LysM repeat protein
LNEPVENLKNLNPELVGLTTPPDSDKPYDLKLPIGSKEIFAANFSKLSEEELNPWVIHAVDKGETVSSIAGQYAVNAQDIIGSNKLPSGNKLKKGMSLRIPREALGTATIAKVKNDSIIESNPVALQNNQTPSPLIASNNQPKDTILEQSQKKETSIRSNPNPVISAPVIAEKQTLIQSQPIESQVPSANSNVKVYSNASQNVIASNQEVTTQIALKSDQIKAEQTQKKSGRAHVMHTVKSGETLYSLAQRYGVRMTDLRNWNGITFDANQLSEGQELIVSSTASPKLVYIQSEKNRDNSPSLKRGGKHTVKKGETLAQIADDYGVELESLRQENKIKKTGSVQYGTVLRIPNQKYADERATRAVSKRRASGSTLKVHSLKKGETLSKIAAMYNVSERDLRSWNPGIKANKIVRGQKIKLYAKVTGKGSSSDSRSKSSSKLPKQYKVRKGDSMKSIANKFGISVSQLKKKNKKAGEGKLKAGQSLRLQ